MIARAEILEQMSQKDKKYGQRTGYMKEIMEVWALFVMNKSRNDQEVDWLR